SPTRYSCVFASVGTPISIRETFRAGAARAPVGNHCFARFRDCQPCRNTVARIQFPKTGFCLMDILVTAVLCYLAIGAAFFAHPASPATPDDFNWRSQRGVFRARLHAVLAWPLTFCR